MPEDLKPGFSRSGVRFNAQPASLPGRILAVVLGAAFLLVTFMFSLIVLAVAVSAGLLVWGYVWWKSRKVRKQMREQPAGTRIIEGEVMRDNEADNKLLR